MMMAGARNFQIPLFSGGHVLDPHLACRHTCLSRGGVNDRPFALPSMKSFGNQRMSPWHRDKTLALSHGTAIGGRSAPASNPTVHRQSCLIVADWAGWPGLHGKERVGEWRRGGPGPPEKSEGGYHPHQLCSFGHLPIQAWRMAANSHSPQTHSIKTTGGQWRLPWARHDTP